MASAKGRPPIENPKSERLFIRVTPEEKREIHQFSKESGYSLLELLRKGMDVAKKK